MDRKGSEESPRELFRRLYEPGDEVHSTGPRRTRGLLGFGVLKLRGLVVVGEVGDVIAHTESALGENPDVRGDPKAYGRVGGAVRRTTDGVLNRAEDRPLHAIGQ